MNVYAPLTGVKVLDLGILIPAALTSGKLAALGADVVKVEQPPRGDRIRVIPPYGDDGRSPQHMAQNWGKRSIGLDVTTEEGRDLILAAHLRRRRRGGEPVGGILGPRRRRFRGVACAASRADRLLHHRLRSDRKLGSTTRAWAECRRARRRPQRRLEERAASPRVGLYQLGQRAWRDGRSDGGVRGPRFGPLRWAGRMDRPVLLGRPGRIAPQRARDDRRRPNSRSPCENHRRKRCIRRIWPATTGRFCWARWSPSSGGGSAKESAGKT